MHKSLNHPDQFSLKAKIISAMRQSVMHSTDLEGEKFVKDPPKEEGVAKGEICSFQIWNLTLDLITQSTPVPLPFQHLKF